MLVYILNICLLKIVGTSKEHSLALANVLVAADYRGHYSHGLNRLGKDLEIFISQIAICTYF